MKKKVLIKNLKTLGANKIREGKRHEVWASKNNSVFTVPRHTEIGETLAKQILEQAQK